MKSFFHRLLGFPIWTVVALSLAGFTALIFFASENSFDFFALIWAFLVTVYLAPRIGVSLWRGTISASDWLAALAIPHVVGLITIMWGPFVYPGRAYAVEMLETEFWAFPTVFLACWLLLCVLITLRNKAVNRSSYAVLRWGGVISVCAMLLLLVNAAFVLTQTLPTFYAGLGADMPISTQNLLASSPYIIYVIPILAMILGAGVIFFSGRRNNVSTGAFDGLIMLLAISNIGSVLGLMVLFLATFPSCGSLWKPDPEWSRARAAPTRLHTAALLGHAESVKRISESRAWISRQVLGDALVFAVLRNREEIVRILLEKNADIRVQTRTAETALHTAARLAHTDIAVLLIKYGADVNVVSLYGTPLDVAEHYKAEGVRKLLLERGAVRATDAQKRTEQEHWDRRVAAVGGPRKSCTDAMGIRAFLENPAIVCAFPSRARPSTQQG